MEILSLKCPQCAGDLKIVGPNHAMCKHCGSSFLLGDEGESVKDATSSGFYGEFPEYGQGFEPAKFFSDFAAKHHGEKFKDIFVGETLTPDHIAESIRYFKVPESEPIYLVVDTSIFNTGRVGFACCETGIYYREDVEHPGFLSWEKFSALDAGGMYLDKDWDFLTLETQDDKLTFILVKEEPKLMLAMFREIWSRQQKTF